MFLFLEALYQVKHKVYTKMLAYAKIELQILLPMNSKDAIHFFQMIIESAMGEVAETTLSGLIPFDILDLWLRVSFCYKHPFSCYYRS
jgi:hypothetical protein